MVLQQLQRFNKICVFGVYSLYLYMEILEFKNEGVYVLKNIVNNKSYIGSSSNIGNRITKHMSLLRHNKHDNNLLQKDFNLYGEKSFIIGILEFSRSNLSIIEQKYVDLYNPEYNITKEVINNIPSIESRLKMSKTRKRLIAEGKIKKQGCRAIIIYDLKGNFVMECESVRETAKTLNIDRNGIFLVLRGKYKQIKGYTFKYKE